ncbi:sulfatase [Roseibacillus ishigakijimensis]|uniref:Sulfatase n=1 Tax=Roseibacillus ishigakijimensis TaxID=454146 RepID=A0A934VHP1_9BACT|nr:sulfatase [Roseibacillus ishigakijimensis]MBK1834183.1 sulfatase [Roseibacillus ishigakijimensis]
MMKKLIALLALVSSCLWADEKPNILVLYSDDAGYADFGFQPNCVPEIKELTPHIDSIAREGVRFSNAYMSGAVCSPSRAGLMTGRYQQRFGFDNNLPPGTKSGASLEETFAAKYLQDQGYRTGLVGKWHLGYPPEYHPNERGFDWFYGLLQGSRTFFPYEKPSPHRVILENKKATPEGGYITDRFGDAACQFIRREKENPFFLFVSFTAPHSPNQPKPEDADRTAHIAKASRRNHCGLTVALDDNIGKILACLEEQGLSEKTLVIFTNDNGGQTLTGADNTPLLGHKGQFTEGGLRVPMAMRWPGKIEAGSVIDDPVISLDFVPTFLQMAGGATELKKPLDGIDLLPRLTGEKSDLPERTLFWRSGGKGGRYAVRQGDWKLLRNGPDEVQLFNLAADISESNNLAAEEPALVAKLQAELASWEAELVEPWWGPGSPRREKRETP